jgi:hypothetical protein
MAEEVFLINSKQPVEVVFKQIEDSLTQLGQVSITKKGILNLNPKSKYSGFLTVANPMEGSVREKGGEAYDVTINYGTKATIACWLIAVIGGMSLLVPALILLAPFYLAKNQIRTDITRAMLQVQQELE